MEHRFRGATIDPKKIRGVEVAHGREGRLKKYSPKNTKNALITY